MERRPTTVAARRRRSRDGDGPLGRLCWREAELRDLLGACGYQAAGLVLHRNEVSRPASQDQAARTARPG
jgi:hypothetical protein